MKRGLAVALLALALPTVLCWPGRATDGDAVYVEVLDADDEGRVVMPVGAPRALHVRITNGADDLLDAAVRIAPDADSHEDLYRRRVLVAPGTVSDVIANITWDGALGRGFEIRVERPDGHPASSTSLDVEAVAALSVTWIRPAAFDPPHPYQANVTPAIEVLNFGSLTIASAEVRLDARHEPAVVEELGPGERRIVELPPFAPRDFSIAKALPGGHASTSAVLSLTVAARDASLGVEHSGLTWTLAEGVATGAQTSTVTLTSTLGREVRILRGVVNSTGPSWFDVWVANHESGRIVGGLLSTVVHPDPALTYATRTSWETTERVDLAPWASKRIHVEFDSSIAGPHHVGAVLEVGHFMDAAGATLDATVSPVALVISPSGTLHVTRGQTVRLNVSFDPALAPGSDGAAVGIAAGLRDDGGPPIARPRGLTGPLRISDAVRISGPYESITRGGPAGTWSFTVRAEGAGAFLVAPFVREGHVLVPSAAPPLLLLVTPAPADQVIVHVAGSSTLAAIAACVVWTARRRR